MNSPWAVWGLLALQSQRAGQESVATGGELLQLMPFDLDESGLTHLPTSTHRLLSPRPWPQQPCLRAVVSVVVSVNAQFPGLLCLPSSLHTSPFQRLLP